MAGRQGDGAGEALGRFRYPSVGEERVGEVVMELGVAGLKRQRPFEAFERRVPITPGLVGQAEIRPRLGEDGVDLHGAPVVGHGLVVPSQALEHVAEVGVAERGVRHRL